MTTAEQCTKNLKIYNRMRNGDTAARDELINENMGLVVYVVADYLSDFPGARYMNDDIIAVGNLALVAAADRLKDTDPGERNINPTGYLRAAITNEIGKYVEEQGPVRVPESSQRMQYAAGEPIFVPKSVGDVDEETICDPDSIRNLLEEIDGVCESDEERMIVSLRRQGYTDQQTADQLGMSMIAVYRLRRDLYKRFLAATGLKGEV